MKAKEIKRLSLELEELIKEKRLEQESERFSTLKSLFDKFCLKHSYDLDGKIYLNDELLVIVIQSYFDDIYRYKLYAKSEYANEAKKSAYMIKWLSKIKPIQIIPNTKLTTKLAFVNSTFSLFVGFSMVEVEIEDCVSPKFFKELIYTTYYRDVCPKQLASLMHVLCNNSKKELP